MAGKRSKLTLGTKNKKFKMCVTNNRVSLNDGEIKSAKSGAEYVPDSEISNEVITIEADDPSIMRGDNRGVPATTEWCSDRYLDNLKLALRDFPWADGTSIPELPPFVSTSLPITDNEDYWRPTSMTGNDDVETVYGWTPLPGMCSHCRRRKTSQSLDKFNTTGVSLNDKSFDSCHNNPLPKFDVISKLNKSHLSDAHSQKTQMVGNSTICINEKNTVCNAPRQTTNSKSLISTDSKSITPMSIKSICPVKASTTKQESNMIKKKMPINPSSAKVSSKIAMKKSQSIMQSFVKSKVESSQTTHATHVNRNSNDDTVTGENDLQSCPLCQKQFEARMSQLDRDGHIAACLSSSTEDVNW